MAYLTMTGLLSNLTSFSLTGLYLFFAYAHLLSFMEHQRASVLLIVIMETIFALFFLTRNRADKTLFSPYAWITTIGGTFCPLFLRPVEVANDYFIGVSLQYTGLFLAIYGILSLNQSIGLLPAHRGIKSTGLYQWIRHPLYSAYTIMQIGYLINNFNAWNLMIVMISFEFQILRIFNEERFLSQYPAYVEYRARTRWRLLPFIF